MQRHLNILFIALLILHLAGCASSKGIRKNDAVAQTLKNTREVQEPLSPVMGNIARERSASEIENLTIDEVIRLEEPNTQTLYDNSRHDFPITVNSRVEGWIDYFTGKGRQHMERYLGRSSRYIPRMKQVFKSSGLPEDLVYLALIESGFNLRARSRARAVGPWQFMKATGKRYGLRVDSWVDERRDPIRATAAAAAYLKDLYLMFESWYLAASAYNAGEYKILRAIESLKTNNYWRISQSRAIRKETKDYIPKLIAAAIIAKNPARYGFDEVSYLEPLEYDVITVDYPLQLKEIAKTIDVDHEELWDLNPHFVHETVPPHGGPYEVRIPIGTKMVVERFLAANGSLRSASQLPTQHTVKNGETLASISKKFHIRTRDLANANNLGPRETISVGTSIVIPRNDKFSIPSRSLTTTAPSSSSHTALLNKPDSDGFIVHKVKSGESLWSIAEHYDVTVQNLFKWNNLKHSAIRPGKPLRVKRPIPAGSAAESKISSQNG